MYCVPTTHSGGVWTTVRCLLSKPEPALLGGCGLHPREGEGGGRESRGVILCHYWLVEQTGILRRPGELTIQHN